jgi:energy-coupling factor transporter ATP-binding protein EcfA2
MSIESSTINPFPGLRPFRQDEDYLFFGREEQTMELLQRLGSHRFVAVVGTSGSGKSSLVRCGLISELLGGKMLQAGASWEIAVTHPGGNPQALLAEALLGRIFATRSRKMSVNSYWPL